MNGNQNRKLSLNMMIYMPEHGRMNLTSQYLIAITIIWYYLIDPKLQYDLKKQLMKRGALREEYEWVPQNYFPQIDRSYDGTDTDHYMPPDADTTVQQLDPTPTNPGSSK